MEEVKPSEVLAKAEKLGAGASFAVIVLTDEMGMHNLQAQLAMKGCSVPQVSKIEEGKYEFHVRKVS